MGVFQESQHPVLYTSQNVGVAILFQDWKLIFKLLELNFTAPTRHKVCWNRCQAPISGCDVASFFLSFSLISSSFLVAYYFSMVVGKPHSSSSFHCPNHVQTLEHEDWFSFLDNVWCWLCKQKQQISGWLLYHTAFLYFFNEGAQFWQNFTSWYTTTCIISSIRIKIYLALFEDISVDWVQGGQLFSLL